MLICCFGLLLLTECITLLQAISILVAGLGVDASVVHFPLCFCILDQRLRANDSKHTNEAY